MKLKLLTLVLLCVCGTLWSQTEKTVLQEDNQPVINEHLLNYANILVANSNDPIVKLANEEAKMQAIKSTYNDLVNNTISADQNLELYTYIINRTVKNDWKPELKALVLYTIQNKSIDQDGKPFYMMDRNQLMADGIDEFYKLIPALDPARGNDDLTSEQQLQLVIEKIDEIKLNDINMQMCLDAFK